VHLSLIETRLRPRVGGVVASDAEAEIARAWTAAQGNSETA